MAKKKSSSTVALVEHNEEHSERLSLEETWPTETQPDEDDGTEVFGSVSEPLDALREEAPREIGLSSEGPFIVLVNAATPDAPTTSKRPKLTVASMTREQAFGLFRDKLFELCFKYGFTLNTNAVGGHVLAFDIGDAKGTAKRALAVGNHISGLELHK